MKTKCKWILTLLLFVSIGVGCGKEEPPPVPKPEVPAETPSPVPAPKPKTAHVPEPFSYPPSSPVASSPAPSSPKSGASSQTRSAPPVAEKRHRVGSYSRSEGAGIVATWHFYSDGTCSFVITGGAPLLPDPVSTPYTREQCEQLESHFKFSSDDETMNYMGSTFRRN